jgi:hypothetical protein
MTNILDYLPNQCSQRGWNLLNQPICSEIMFMLAGRAHTNDSAWQNHQMPDKLELSAVEFNTVDQIFEKFYGTQWLLDSFYTTQVFVYDETVTSEVLFVLYDYFKRQACNAENVVVVINSSVGVNQWWNHWKQLHQVKSFHILELPLHAYWFTKFYEHTKFDNLAEFIKNKEIKYTFSLLGGSRFYEEAEKEFVYFYFKSLANGICDYNSGRIHTLEKLIGWVEERSYYSNQALVDQITDSYQDNYTNHGNQLSQLKLNYSKTFVDKSGVVHNGFGLDSFYHAITRHSAINIMRESTDLEPFNTCSQKSMMPLMLGCIPIGLSHHGDATAKLLGFQTPITPFDHRIQEIYEIPYFIERIVAIGDLLDELSKVDRSTQKDWIVTNLDVYLYNADRYLSGDFYMDARREFERQCELLKK